MKNKIYCFLVLFIIVFLTMNYFPKMMYAEGMNRIQESEDFEVISNLKTPELKLKIVFKEELSIGEIEGDENYMFGMRVYFNVDDEGNIYVTDWDRKRIQKYNPQGKYIQTIGRKGQGPGEFQNVWVPRFDEDSNMYVTDIAGHRISFFDKEGKFLKQIIIPSISSSLYINSKGYFITTKSLHIEEKDGEKFVSVFGFYDDKFNIIKEIHRSIWEPKNPTGRDEKSMAQFLANIMSDMAFRPNISYFLTDDGLLYFGYPEKYEICIFSSEGKIIKTIRREYDPIRISKKHKNNFVKSMEDDFLRLSPYPEGIKKQASQLIKYPKFKPAYQDFTLMDNGWLLVIIDSSEKDSKLIDIFDQYGKYIAQFTTSVSTNRLIFKNSKAYALAIENDYRFVKRYNYEIQEYKNNRWVKR